MSTQPATTLPDQVSELRNTKVVQTSLQARAAELHKFADHSMSREQAGEAVLTDLDTLRTLKGRERTTAVGTMGRIAESQRAYGEALAETNPIVSDQALATAEQEREAVGRAQAEYRQSPEGIAAAPQADKLREAVRVAEVQHDGWRAERSYAELGPVVADRVTVTDAQVLKGIESRHVGLQAVPAGALDITAAREAARQDVVAMNTFTDRGLKDRAAGTMGDTADQHQTYKTALTEVGPGYASLADRAFADDQQKSAAKEARKAIEYADRRNDAAQEIATRYANMKVAGLSVKDLQGPAVDRLAVMDGRALLLLEGQPPHAREGEARALVAESMKSPAYRATFTRETAEWTMSDTGRQAGGATNVAKIDTREQTAAASTSAADQKQSSKDASAPEREGTGSNSMRAEGETSAKRRAIPPLEDRFNVVKSGLVAKEYHFRDQAGKVAFTEKMFSLNTTSESPAAIKAMVDRAAERGWETVSLKGSPEFVRQGWIAANAHGLKAVGHTPTPGDREAVAKERARLEVGRAAEGIQRQGETIARVQAERFEQTETGKGDRSASGLSAHRQLAAAIEKALLDGKVSPEIRGQLRDMMAAEGARRMARGDRIKVPVYDARAPRARAKTIAAGPQRVSDRERSR